MDSLCFCPEKLSVYGGVALANSEQTQLSDEEIIINRWLDETGVLMSDPLDIVYSYFEKKKTQIAAEKNRLLAKKPSNLWARRKEMSNRNTATTSPDLSSSSKSSVSSDDGTSGFFD